MSFGKKQQDIKNLDEVREKLTKLSAEYSSLAFPFTHRSTKARKARLFLDAFRKLSGEVIDALAATTRMIGPGDKDLTVPEGGYSSSQAFARWQIRLVFAMVGAVKTIQSNQREDLEPLFTSIGDGVDFVEILGGSQFLRLYWQALVHTKEQILHLRDILISVNQCA